MKKAILISIIGILGVSYFFILKPRLPIINAYAAKQMCTYTFTAGLPQEKIQKENLHFFPINLTSSKINIENETVETSFLGLGKQKVVYKDRLGCVQIHGEDEYKNSFHKAAPPTDSLSQLNNVFKNIRGVDYQELNNVINNLITPTEEYPDRRTLALAYFYKDTLVGEWYAPDYNEYTPILGWSMTKSITSALMGIMHKNGDISLNDNHLFPEWDQDERKNITLDNLLQMQSGLDFNEDYQTESDATSMLYRSEEVTAIPLSKKLIHPPGTFWEYSSGTTNLLSGFIKNKFDDIQDYYAFPYDSLFYRIGMNSAILETDESGTFIGSSYCYASARDWGRFGLLYLNDGNWWGDQVIDSTWVSYTSTANTHSKGRYGGHFWQNEKKVAYPDAPSDLYECSGFQGQYVLIIPSYDLVIVRLGVGEDLQKNNFIKNSLAAFDQVKQ